MRKAEKGLRTRNELAAALKELLKEKPITQVRVRELTDCCGLYRQTFYYHFEDVYDLLDWAFQQDVELLACWPMRYAARKEALLAFLDEVDEYRGYYAEVLNTRTFQRQKQLLYETFVHLSEESICCMVQE